MVCLAVVVGSTPAFAAWYDYGGYVSPAGVSPGVWSMMSDAQRYAYAKEAQLAAAMLAEQAAGGTSAGPVASAYSAYQAGTGTGAAVEAASSVAVKSVTVGEVASATGKTTAEVTRGIIGSKAAFELNGVKAWASKAGINGSTFASSLGLMSLYWQVAQELPNVYLHDDGQHCSGPYPCPLRHHLPVPPSARSDTLPGVDWEREVVDEGLTVVTRVMTPGPVDSPILTNISAPPYADSFYTWTGPAVSIVNLVHGAISNPTGMFYVSNWSNYTAPFGYIQDVTTGETAAIPGGLYGGVTGRTPSEQYFWLYGFTPTQAQADTLTGWAAARVAAAEAAGRVSRDSEVSTGSVAPVPFGFPTGPGTGVAQVDVPLDADGSFSPDLELGDAVDSVTFPGSVPTPVEDEILQELPDTEFQDAPYAPPVVNEFIGDIWDSITAPVRGLFDGIDIFWPFRFMAGSG